jgi:ribonuclease HI
VIKSQIVADFVTEWTDTQLPLSQIRAECLTLYFDGSVMKTGAGAGLLFVSPLGEHMRYAVRLHFPASNNMAKYETLLCGLRIAIEMGIKRLDVRGDSQLVIDQVMKNTSCHDDKMEAYCKAVRALEDKFYGIELSHVPRRYNEEADELAKITSGRITIPPNVFARDVIKPSVDLEPNPSSREEPSGLPRVHKRRAHGRGPLEQGVRTRPAQGVWRR